VRVATTIINGYNRYKNTRVVYTHAPWYATLSTDGRLSCLKSSSDTCERHKQPTKKKQRRFPMRFFNQRPSSCQGRLQTRERNRDYQVNKAVALVCNSQYAGNPLAGKQSLGKVLGEANAYAPHVVRGGGGGGGAKDGGLKGSAVIET
jgi:hypothetical protein